MKYRPDIIERVTKLEEKFATIGQDTNAYLDGLLYSNVTTYWDYINVDALLSLQRPKTDYPDELIFIMYHQVTELYFRLALHEMEQIANNGRDVVIETGEDKGWKNTLDPKYFTERIKRINNYFEALIKSFDIMGSGMDKQQFLRFRMALLPASGFQSAQYRMIEIEATDFIRLVDKDARTKFEKGKPSIEKMFEHIYWKKGATEMETGKKTLTLIHFEKKYAAKLIALAKDYKDKNLWAKYKSLSKVEQKNKELINALKQLDVNVNVNWPLVHYKSAARYLEREKNEAIAATGGTNWQKYLPPRFQKRMFYPELWTAAEKENWGKSWVESIVNKK